MKVSYLTSLTNFKEHAHAEYNPVDDTFEAEVKLPPTVMSFEYKAFVNGCPVTLGVRSTSFGQNNVFFVPVSAS